MTNRDDSMGGVMTQCALLVIADFTPLERLLEQYMEAEAHYGQKQSEQGGWEDEDGANGGTEAEDGAQSSSKKPSRRRFNFEDWHDLVLLNAVLNDEGIVMTSGEWKHAWKSVEAAVNSQGVCVKAHSIRGHLRLMLGAYRMDPSAQSLDPAEMSAKQKFLREYCTKLDDMKCPREANDQSIEALHEEHEERGESGEANSAGRKRRQASVNAPGSVEPAQGNSTASEHQAVTCDRQATQSTQPISTAADASRAPSGPQSRLPSLQRGMKLRERLHQLA
jgi:hypothetical protein